MDAWMAFLSIMAIVAIVVICGGLIAFIGHVIIGALGADKRVNDSTGYKNPSQNTGSREVLDYAQFKQLESSKQAEVDKYYDFEEINKEKAEKEKALAEASVEDTMVIPEADKDEALETIENRLKSENETKVEKVKVEETTVVEEDDDLDDLLSEISEDIIQEEKEKAQEEAAPKASEELNKYSIDKILEETEEIEESEEEEIAPVEEIVEEEVVEEKPVVVPVEDKSEELHKANSEIESLKAQLFELNRKLEEARTQQVEVVTIDMTEAECVARLELLEERLKNVKKDYKINLKEYKPLKKVMNDLERNQTKLRRKETVLAKKKVSLYGVNNYVDIDKEKAEKLANEIELVEGLRLSVAHCEEVINANKDRFPVLEHTNKILEDQISNIEADIASTQETLRKIREKNGTGSDDNSETPVDQSSEDEEI